MILPVTEQGDAAGLSSFEQLLLAHSRPVLRLAVRLTGNLHDAQDVSQDVFLKLYREWKRFGNEAEVLPWLYRVTINACFDTRRKAKRSRLTIISSDLRSAAPTPEDTARNTEDAALLQAGLESLTDRERAAIALRELEGLSTAEVAQILGSAESTVRVQISAARVKLRRFFEKVRGNTL